MKTIILILIGLCAFRIADAQAIMEPTNQPVTLSGTIREIHGYGPPGFGETKKIDSHFNYLVVVLHKQINIACTPESPEWEAADCAPTRQLQLFFPSAVGEGLELKVRKAKGKTIQITGMLKRQVAPMEMTPIYIEVTSIEGAGVGL